MRGPVVYCLEFPKKLDGEERWNRGVFLPANVKLRPEHRPGLFGGMTVLRGTALTRKGRQRFEEMNSARQGRGEGWEGVLYREYRPSHRNLKMPTGGTTDITLIPYYSWANRGVSFMEVWMPLAPEAE